MKDPVEAIKEFIRFPSVSTDSEFKEGMLGARDYIAGLLEEIGFSITIVETDCHPIVLAEREAPEGSPHILLYGHYDVQPADPYELWSSEPYEAEIRNGRLYGRGAADNKGPFMVHVAAMARLLKEEPELPLKITVMVEGEEEIGSPSLDQFLKDYKDKLSKADFVMLSDTSSHSPEQITMTTGLRGIVCLEVELTGPAFDLHSGIHGGAVYNPVQALTEICASLHDVEGKVSVPGFYDGIEAPQQWERDELKKLDLQEADYADFLGVKGFHALPGYTPFEAIRFWPTLEFNGIGGGYQGEGTKTVIPSKAFAKISCRLVAGQDPVAVQTAVIKAVEERCPSAFNLKITKGHCCPAYRVVPPEKPDTPADQSPVLAKAFKAADDSIEKAFGKAPVYLREGGSVPIISDLKNALGLDSLMMGMFTVEDNLHAPDESLHLGMFHNGVEASYGIFKSIAES